MKQFILIQLFWMSSFALSAQINSENALRTANPAVNSVEIPVSEQSVLRSENPMNKTSEKQVIITDLKMQNPATLQSENPIKENNEMEDPKKD